MDFFLEKLIEHKDGPKAVGWGSKESQELRFAVLSEVADLKNKSVLDIGCGLGDLYEYLRQYDVNYTGYDVLPEMVDAANKKYPKGKFVKEFPKEKFDYVVASGTFNIKPQDLKETIYPVLVAMFNLAKKGMAINFLSINAPKKNELSFYVDPLEAIMMIRNLTPRFILRHEYKQNDFSLYLYK